MSKYTTELRFICEQKAGLAESVGYDKVDDVIEAARLKIFDFNFPIFDEDYRPELERKILKHFYTREICAETYGLWHLWFAERMQEIMPGMNKLYNSNLLEFNPLYDVDLKTERTGTETGTSSEATKDQTSGSGTTRGSASGTNSSQGTNTSQGTTTGSNTAKHSDTPQGGITGLASGSYLSSADMEDSSGTSSGSSSSSSSASNSSTTSGSSSTSATSSGSRSGEHSGKTTYIERITGKRGGQTYAQMIEDLRASFINVDQLIFNALEDLFFELW